MSITGKAIYYRNNNRKTREEVRRELQLALDGVSEVLKSSKSGVATFSNEEELTFLSKELAQMLVSLDTGEKRPTPGLWRIVTDTWPVDEPLRQAVLDAEYNYERLKL